MPIGAGGSIGGGLGGAIGGGLGLLLAGQGGMGEFREIVALMRKLKDPNFDMRQLTAPELQILGEMAPQIYNPVLPEQAATVIDSPGLRESQAASLGTLEAIRDQGLPVQDRLAATQAQNAILQAQGGASLDAARAAAERGRGGSGYETQARILGNQGVQNLAAQLGMNLQEQALGRRPEAAMAAAGVARGLRGQDIGLRQYNADIVNRFNELVTGRQTQAAQYGAGARERAQEYNVPTRQRIGEQNILARSAMEVRNQEYQNLLRDLATTRERERVGMLAGAIRGKGNVKELRRQDRIALGQSIGQGIGQAGGGLLGI